MVKVGILSAHTPMAGEMIRILVNHPETELVNLFAPSLAERNLSSIHHGLIGETQLKFSDKLNLGDLDFLAIMEPTEIAKNIVKNANEFENLRLVVFEKDFPYNNLPEDFEIGLSEINRKALVRGAKLAYIPSAAIVPSLISLVPLAYYMLLNSDIDIEVTVPEFLVSYFDSKREANFLEDFLRGKQTSFNGKINLKINGDSNNSRGLKTKIRMNSSIPVEEIEKIYDHIYDDHNFTFLTRNELDSKETEGTQKIVITLKKPQPDVLVIESIGDAIMRGGAGDIVHIINLFFGLHEKTGLNLKSSRYN